MGKPAFIDTGALQGVPWKNSGGTTREIAQAKGPKGFAWRLSMADVETEGPFSAFPGMRRILTVIDGDGLELHDRDQAHVVPCCTPFHFAGDTQIRSVLRAGKIRDFNVIYDADRVGADVRVLDGPLHKNICPDGRRILAVFGVTGLFSLGGQIAGREAFALLKIGTVPMALPEHSKVLIVELEQVDPSGHASD